MANKTQMTTTIIRGEMFTKDKPGYVELVNPQDQNEQIKTIINKLSQVTTNQSAQTNVLETIKDTLNKAELETLIKVLGVSRNILHTQQEIQDTLTQVKERLDEPISTQLTGSYVGYSNDTKPTGKKGETFLELDTLDVYIHDSSGWVKIT